MARHRSEQRSHCPINFALETFGDPWTLLIIRDMIFEGKRGFREFLGSEERIASNILSDRLKRLQASGILKQDRISSDYSLTRKGLDLIPLLLELIAWGAKHDPETAAPLSFLRRFKRDKEGLSREIRSTLSKTGGKE